MSKHQGVTWCTPRCSDVASSWDHRLIALEGMMAQVVAIVTKNSGNQMAIMTPSQGDGLIMPLTPIGTLCDLEQNFATISNQPRSGA
jgi:hypothetical protein